MTTSLCNSCWSWQRGLWFSHGELERLCPYGALGKETWHRSLGWNLPSFEWSVKNIKRLKTDFGVKAGGLVSLYQGNVSQSLLKKDASLLRAKQNPNCGLISHKVLHACGNVLTYLGKEVTHSFRFPISYHHFFRCLHLKPPVTVSMIKHHAVVSSGFAKDVAWTFAQVTKWVPAGDFGHSSATGRGGFGAKLT